MARDSLRSHALLTLVVGIVLIGNITLGATIATAQDTSFDRSPESVSVQPGDTVKITVEVVAGDGGLAANGSLNLTSESIEGGQEHIEFSKIVSEADSPTIINDPGGFALAYDTPVVSDTITYTVEVASDAPAGTYTIEGTAVTDTEDTTGSTTIQVGQSSDPVDSEPDTGNSITSLDSVTIIVLVVVGVLLSAGAVALRRR